MSECAQMPINIRIEKARNELRYGLNVISSKYNLPGCIVDLILDSIRSEECQQRVSLTVEQITGVDKEISPSNENGTGTDDTDSQNS